MAINQHHEAVATGLIALRKGARRYDCLERLGGACLRKHRAHYTAIERDLFGVDDELPAIEFAKPARKNSTKG